MTDCGATPIVRMGLCAKCLEFEIVSQRKVVRLHSMHLEAARMRLAELLGIHKP